jgi:uncharacterized protein YeaO (DUF488 family)
MTLQVFTARISSKDPDRLDISRKSGKEGAFLAPSWSLLAPFLELRHHAALTQADWDAYVEGFRKEMRQSYRENRKAWEALLARERVVLTCYCTNHNQCHRTLLRRDILPALGAVNVGEIAT